MWFQMSLAAVKSLAPNFAAFAVKISRIKAGGFVFWQPLLCPRQWARLWKTEESVSGFSPPLTTDSTTLEFPDPYLLPPGLALHPVSPAALRPSKHHKPYFSFYRCLAFNIIMNYYHYPVLLAHYCWLDCEADLRLSILQGPFISTLSGRTLGLRQYVTAAHHCHAVNSWLLSVGCITPVSAVMAWRSSSPLEQHLSGLLLFWLILSTVWSFCRLLVEWQKPLLQKQSLKEKLFRPR